MRRTNKPMILRELPKTIGHVLHVDTVGPIEPTTLGGAKYYTTFIEGKSKFAWVNVHKTRLDIISLLKFRIKNLKRETKQKLFILQTDKAGEFYESFFKEWLLRKGIRHQTSLRGEHYQNGTVERLQQTLNNKANTIMIHANAEPYLWGEAISTAVELYNRSAHSQLNNLTPYEIYKGQKPQLKFLRVWGCECFTYIPKDQRPTKFTTHATRCKFVGYSTHCKGYRCIDIFNKHRVILSRNVQFNENEAPSLEHPHKKNFSIGIDTPDTFLYPQKKYYEDSDPPMDDSFIGNLPFDYDFNDLEDFDQPEIWSSNSEHTLLSEISTKNNQTFKDTSTNVSAVGYTNLKTPTNFKDAMRGAQSKEWLSSMEEEYNSLKQMQVFELVPRSTAKNVIKGKWVFRIKEDSQGNPVRFKSRYVAKGYTQRFGIDYFETFAPVVRIQTLRIIMSLAMTYGWHLMHCNIRTAYLYGEMDTEAYLEQPEGFKKCIEGIDSKDVVMKLKKSIYGLHQAGRNWYETLAKHLISNGMIQSRNDPTLFIRHGDNGQISGVSIYVDDCEIFGTDENQCMSIIECINQKFKLTEATELKWLLGIEIITTRKNKMKINQICMSQKTYIDKMMKKFKLEGDDVKPLKIPMPVNLVLKIPDKSYNSTEERKYLYQSMIGSMMYLAVCTRPDISFATGVLGRFASNPDQSHLDAAIRVLRYIKGTRNYELVFTKGNSILKAFSDADFAGTDEKCRSTTGSLLQLGNNAIHWKHSLQRLVALHSTESEILALLETVKEVVWTKKLLSDLKETEKIIEIFVDNEPATKIANSIMSIKRTKHFNVKTHYIMQKVDEKEISVSWISTKDNKADIFTKTLPGPKLQKARSMLGLKDIDRRSTSRGSVKLSINN